MPAILFDLVRELDWYIKNIIYNAQQDAYSKDISHYVPFLYHLSSLSSDYFLMLDVPVSNLGPVAGSPEI
jgi:hypothetical protein